MKIEENENAKIKIIPLGGLEQIGMNMTLFEYEDSIITNLLNTGLIIKNNNFIIDKEEDIYDFISDKLNTLSKLYNVFTSKKIDNTKIVKNTSSNNNFSIGNGILTYDFNIDGIDTIIPTWDDVNPKVFSKYTGKKVLYAPKPMNKVKYFA